MSPAASEKQNREALSKTSMQSTPPRKPTFVRRWVPRVIFLLFLVVVALYAKSLAWRYSHRELLLYGARPGATVPPTVLPIRALKISFQGREISVWDVAPDLAVKSVSETVLYLHGTDINLLDTVPTLQSWHDLGYRVIALDYRGFGESTGKPSMLGFVDDAQAVMRWMINDEKIFQDSIIVHGHSLGSGVAVQLGVREPAVHSALLEGAFTTAEEILADNWGWYYPWRNIVGKDHDAYNAIGTIRKLTMPVLVVHGGDDRSVLPSQGKRLAARVKCGEFLLISGKVHTDVFPTVGSTVIEALNRVMKKCA
jgi:uncharacterized protein